MPSRRRGEPLGKQIPAVAARAAVGVGAGVEELAHDRGAALLSGVSDSPRLEAEALLAYLLKKPRSHLLAWPEKELTPPEAKGFEILLRRRFSGEPVAYIRGIPGEITNSNGTLKMVVENTTTGEVLRVFVLKEGKEAGQGVAYLDDGTMVVVDQGNGRSARPSRSRSPACCRRRPGR